MNPRGFKQVEKKKSRRLITRLVIVERIAEFDYAETTHANKFK
jgi:hypothetical protein